MITLKYWNSLSPEVRKHIAYKFYDNRAMAKSLSAEYHHSFNYDDTGLSLAMLLSACYRRGGNIEMRCIVNPTLIDQDRILKEYNKERNSKKL